MRYLFRGAVVLLIALAMVFSTVAIADTEIKETGSPTLTTTHEGTAEGARGDIVWDNGMNYDGICTSQYDTAVPFESECADDFHFEEDTEVCDVHWVAAYWNGDTYNQVHWPWKITFYTDDGTGNAPGGVYAGPYTYDPTQYTETLLEDTGDPASGIYYEISVDLPENILFPACYKFWISIQGIGDYPPQSGWGYHFDPIMLHEAVLRSIYFGFPDWTPWSEVAPPDERDLCFQLTKKPECEPSIDVEKYVWDPKNQEWVDADTQDEALDLPICDDATFKIVIHNNGNVDLKDIIVNDKMSKSLEFKSGDPEPDSVYYEEPFWYMEWYFPGPLPPCATIEIYITAHVVGPECEYDFNYVLVEAQGCGQPPVRDDDYAWVHEYKTSREINTPLLNLIEFLLSQFPILKALFGL